MFDHVLILCAGNICRSPMALGFFQQALQGKSIALDSAGIIGLSGQPADASALTAMHEVGIDISSHVAKKLDKQLSLWADVILVMTTEQVKQVQAAYPHTAGKTYRLGHWSGFDVADPYRKPQSAFTQARESIRQGVDDWLTKL